MQSYFGVFEFCLLKKPKKQPDAQYALRTLPTIHRQYTNTNASTKGAIDNLYPLDTIRTYINVYPLHSSLIPKFSLIIKNLINQHRCETQIKGHHPGHPNCLCCYIILYWQCNSSQHLHGVVITSVFPKILHPLWTRKVGTIICNIICHSLTLWPYIPKIYQALLQYKKFLFNELVGKNFYIQEGL